MLYYRGHTPTETKPWYYSQENYRKSMLYQRSYSHRNKTVVLQPRKLQEVYVVPEVILLTETKPWYYSQENYRKSMLYQRSYSTETKPWYYSQENYRKSMLYQRSYSYRNKTVVLQPRKLQEVYVVPEVILPQKQNRGIIAKKTTGSLCCTRGHTPTETKPWYYSQENYRKSMLYQRSYSHRNKTVVLQPRKLQEVYVVPEVILHRNKTVVLQPRKLQEVYCIRGHTPTETKPLYSQRSYSHRNKTVVLQPRKLQEVYVVPEVILPQKQNRGTRGHIAKNSQENYRKSKLYQRSYFHRNKTVVLQPRKLQEVYVVAEVILLQKQNRGIIAKKTTGSLCCTRGHTPTETKPWYYSQENYRKSMLYQRSYSHRNKTVVLQPRKLQEVYVVPEVILPQKQNRGIIAKKTTGSLCCTRGHTPTETKPWYYSQENYRKSMLYQRSYSHRNKTVVLQPRKLQEVYCTHTPTETKPWYYSQENYRKSMLYQRSYSHRNKTVVLQPRKLQEVYVVPEVILLQKQNRGIIAKKTTGSLCCTRGHTPQKQNRGIIAKKTTGSLCCTRGHTPTETKPWYYSQENYRKSKLYQRSYFHRNKTVVLQPRKLQEVYVVPEVILLQKQNRGIIAKKTTGSLSCTRGHTPTETKPWYYSQENYRGLLYHTSTETKPWYYSQENYRKSMLYQRSYSYRNKTVVLQPRKLQEVYVVPEVILPQKQNRGIIARKSTEYPTETKPWYYSQENYRKSMLYQRSYSHRNKTVVLQPRKLQEVYVVPEVILPQKQNRGIRKR